MKTESVCRSTVVLYWDSLRVSYNRSIIEYLLVRFRGFEVESVKSCWRSSYIIKSREMDWGASCGLPNFGWPSQYFSDDFGHPSSGGVQPVNITATEISLTQKQLGQTIVYHILKFTIYSRHKYYSRANIYKSRCYQKHDLVLQQTPKP